MDSSTPTTRGCLLQDHPEHHRTFAELTGAYWMDPPIYTELLADWRARGRAVPGSAAADVPRAAGLSGGTLPQLPPGTGQVPPR